MIQAGYVILGVIIGGSFVFAVMLYLAIFYGDDQ